MAFQLFQYKPEIDHIVSGAGSSIEKMENLSATVGDGAFPPYLRRFILQTCPNGPRSIALHTSFSIANYSDADQDRIERRRGFMGKSDLQQEIYPQAIHHLKVYHNGLGRARLFYKFIGSVQFIKNIRNDT
jgi:hypothetical protein